MFLRLALAGIAMLSAQDAVSQEWCQFRGPNGSGVLARARIPAEFGPEANVLWKAELGEGQSSPVVWRNRVFVTTCAGEQKRDLTTCCFDRATGKVVWRKTVRAKRTANYFPRLNGPASPTPAVDAARIYVYFGTYGLVCYDHAGETLWEHPIEPPASQYGVSTSPILHDDKVILVLDDNTGKSRILAIARESGEKLWEQPRPLLKAAWSTPMIWSVEGKHQIVVLGSGRLIAHDPATGKQIWSAGGFSEEPIGVPVAGAGLLFVSDAAVGGRGEPKLEVDWSFGLMLRKYDKNEDQQLQREEVAAGFHVPLRRELERGEPGSAFRVERAQVGGWFGMLDRDKDGAISKADFRGSLEAFTAKSKPTLLALRPGAEGDVGSSHVAWKIHSGIPEVPSPLFHDGRVYLLRKGGRLFCVDAKTGKKVYRENLGARGNYIASPIVAGDKLITASERGVVCVLDAGAEFRVLSRNEFRERIYATPAVARRALYVRTAGHLYAIGVRER